MADPRDRDAALSAMRMIMTGSFTVRATAEAAQIVLCECIGILAHDLAAGDAAIDTIASEMKRDLRANWDYLREHRATIVITPEAGHG